MKKTHSFFLFFLCVFLLGSCNRSSYLPNKSEDNPEEDVSGHPHTYKEVKDVKFIKSYNTSSYGDVTFYKSCDCGSISTETFTIHNNLSHGISNKSVKTGMEFLDEFEITSYIPGGQSTASIFFGSISLERYKYTYQSYLDGELITLSGAVTFPFKNGTLQKKGLIIDSHPTIIGNDERPSAGFDLYTLNALNGYVVLECDLLGYGETSNKPVDYHCSHLCNRNTIDGVLGLLDILKTNYDYEPTKIYNIGYSQGGYEAMSILRYMEKEASSFEKNKIPIKKTYAGSGAYDLSVMLTESLQNSNFDCPEYIIMAIMTAYYYHPEYLGDYKVEDFLTPYGQEFITPLLNKNLNDVLTVKNKQSHKPSDVFKSDLISGSSDYMSKMNDYCAKENLIDGSWLPTGNLELFYVNSDELVTPECSKKAKMLFKETNNLSNVTIKVGSGSSHVDAGEEFYKDFFLANLM